MNCIVVDGKDWTLNATLLHISPHTFTSVRNADSSFFEGLKVYQIERPLIDEQFEKRHFENESISRLDTDYFWL